jgi:hypothetical protein
VNDSLLTAFTAGRFWMAKCTLTALLASLMLSTAPAVFVNRDIPLPPAYALKAQKPFADTATLTIPEHPGERSHGAKLTPRLVGSVLLYLVSSVSLHPYWPATVFGLLFLLSGIRIGYRLSEDRVIGLFTGLLFAGLYASSACFSLNWMPKPFDGVAIGLLGLTMISIERQWLLGLMALLSCWADERAVLSLVFIAVLVLVWPSFDHRTRLMRCLALAGGVLTYLLTRALLTYALAWQNPDLGMIGMDAELAFLSLPLAAWSGFEGGWIAILFAAWVLYGQRQHTRLALLAGSVTIAVLACLLVLDISRVGSFVFPLIPVSLALLQGQGVSRRDLRLVTAAAALVTLMAPNFEIIAGVAVKWLAPLVPLLPSLLT